MGSNAPDCHVFLSAELVNGFKVEFTIPFLDEDLIKHGWPEDVW